MPAKPKEEGSPKKIDGVVAVVLGLCKAMEAVEEESYEIQTI